MYNRTCWNKLKSTQSFHTVHLKSTEVTTTDNNSIQAILEWRPWSMQPQKTKIWISHDDDTFVTSISIILFYRATPKHWQKNEEINFKQIWNSNRIYKYITTKWYNFIQHLPFPNDNPGLMAVRPCSVWWIATLWISFPASWNHPTPSRMPLPSSLGFHVRKDDKRFKGCVGWRICNKNVMSNIAGIA